MKIDYKEIVAVLKKVKWWVILKEGDVVVMHKKSGTVDKWDITQQKPYESVDVHDEIMIPKEDIEITTDLILGIKRLALWRNVNKLFMNYLCANKLWIRGSGKGIVKVEDMSLAHLENALHRLNGHSVGKWADPFRKMLEAQIEVTSQETLEEK